MTTEQYCVVCGSAGARVHGTPRDASLIECNRCGRFEISGSLSAILHRQSRYIELRPFLSAALRQAHDRGERLVLGTTNWEALASEHEHTTVPRKLDLLLRLFGARSPTLGTGVVIGPDDFVLLDAADNQEVDYLVGALADQGLIRINPRGEGLIITPVGWERLSPHTAEGIPGTCFVAMAFDPALDTAFSEGILAAAETDCGFRVLRVDRDPHNDDITDRIVAGIREAQFVIADFTLQRQGVYYEAGFAVGLGRTLIRTCRDSDFKHLHFDTRQFFHLKWRTPGDLRTRLADHIRATIGAFALGRR